MDYIAYDPGTNSVWCRRNTGAVDVVDVATTRCDKFPAFLLGRGNPCWQACLRSHCGQHRRRRRLHRQPRRLDVCAFNSTSLAKGACDHLDSTPDAVVYVAPTKEVWVTTPDDKSIHVLDGKTLEQKAKLDFEGNPRDLPSTLCTAVSIPTWKDKDRTLSIDLKTARRSLTGIPRTSRSWPHQKPSTAPSARDKERRPAPPRPRSSRRSVLSGPFLS